MPTDGRWDRYRDHTGAEFQRVSTLIKKVETDDYHLQLWYRRQVLVGASRRDDLIMGAKAMKPHPVTGWSDAQKRDLNKLVAKAEEAAKDEDGGIVGTAKHTLTERLDRGEALDDVVAGLPAQLERDVRAYEALVRLNGWRSVEIERTVVNDELDVAGTFDRVTLIPDLYKMLGPGQCQYGHDETEHSVMGLPGGELPVIMDVKSERDPTKNGLHIGPQLAIYSRAGRMWLPSGKYVDAPCVRQDVAVAVHVRDGHATPYFVDIRSGWEAAVAARAQNEREKAAKRWLAPMPGVREPAPMEVAGQTAEHQRTAPAPEALVMPPLELVREEVAVQVAPGVVAWEPVQPDAPIGTQTVVGGVTFTKIDTVENSLTRGALDDVNRQAIDTVRSAADVAALGEVWRIYTQVVGRAWGGRVAEAAEARRRQIECVQRPTHGAPGGLKCACGWTKGVAP